MTRAASLMFVVFAVGALGCKEGVPAPGFAAPLDSATPAQIREYLKKLKFDSREGSSDEQVLTVGCPAACKAGPLVAIQPEFRTYRNRESDLRGSPGRIIAKLINRDKKQAYPALNLGPEDTVYWAVDQVKRVEKGGQLEGRSLFISDQGLRGVRDSIVVHRELYIDEHPGEPEYGQALARWVPAKTGKYGATLPRSGGPSIAPDRAPPQIQGELFIGELMAWNNCKSGGCCR